MRHWLSCLSPAHCWPRVEELGPKCLQREKRCQVCHLGNQLSHGLRLWFPAFSPWAKCTSAVLFPYSQTQGQRSNQSRCLCRWSPVPSLPIQVEGFQIRPLAPIAPRTYPPVNSQAVFFSPLYLFFTASLPSTQGLCQFSVVPRYKSVPWGAIEAKQQTNCLLCPQEIGHRRDDGWCHWAVSGQPHRPGESPDADGRKTEAGREALEVSHPRNSISFSLLGHLLLGHLTNASRL